MKVKYAGKAQAGFQSLVSVLLCALVILASPLSLVAQDGADSPTVPNEVPVAELSTDVPTRDGVPASGDPAKSNGDEAALPVENAAALQALFAEMRLGRPPQQPLLNDPWPLPLLDEAARAALPSETATGDPAFMDGEWYLTPDDPGSGVADEEGASAAEMAEPDIVGGTSATAGEFPWQGVLLVNGTFNCGASLIHPSWALTAAHCLTDPYGDGTWDALPPSMFTLVFGDHTRSTTDGNEVYRDVVQVAVHPYYNANSITNDIALLKLETPVPLSARIQTIPIATTAEQDAWGNPGKSATVSGWGRIATGGALANSLMKATQPVITPAACSTAFAGINPITADMICVGMGGVGSCNGDSGGPLVVPSSGGWRQVGIVSWGSSVCESRPSVYTRAAYFRNWVTAIMAPTYVPAVVNPGFESGNNGAWVQSSGDILISSGQPTHAGNVKAWLGGADSVTHLIWQNVLLTDRATTMKFWYLVRSQESGCTYDRGLVVVDGFSKLVIPLCASNAAAGWREATVNLEPGRTSWIGFFVDNDSSIPSSLYVDDVTVTTVGQTPAAITSFSPTTARDGELITVNGSGMLGVTKVAFGAVSAPFTILSNTQLRVTVPAAARSGKIVITSSGGTAQSTQDFTKIHTLTMRILGLGTGTVTQQGGGGLPHGTRIDMGDGASITLTAAPSGTSTLQSWTAPCAGKGASCTFTAISSSVLTVVFDSPTAQRTYLSVVDR